MPDRSMSSRSVMTGVRHTIGTAKLSSVKLKARAPLQAHGEYLSRSRGKIKIVSLVHPPVDNRQGMI